MGYRFEWDTQKARANLRKHEKTMKKSKTKSGSGRFEDTMRAEYDFSNAVRGVTAARYGQGSNVVLLDPDVAEIFPDARAVNEALRTLARLTKPAFRSHNAIGTKRRS